MRSESSSKIQDLGDRIVAIGRLRIRGKKRGRSRVSGGPRGRVQVRQADSTWTYLDPNEALQAAGCRSKRCRRRRPVDRPAPTRAGRPHECYPWVTWARSRRRRHRSRCRCRSGPQTRFHLQGTCDAGRRGRSTRRSSPGCAHNEAVTSTSVCPPPTASIVDGQDQPAQPLGPKSSATAMRSAGPAESGCTEQSARSVPPATVSPGKRPRDPGVPGQPAS